MVNGMVWVSSAAIFWLMAEHFHPTTKRILYYTFYRCLWYKSWGSKLVRKEVQGERAISNRNQGWTRFAEFGWDETVVTNRIPVRAQPGDWRGRKTTHSGELWDRRQGAGGSKKGHFMVSNTSVVSQSSKRSWGLHSPGGQGTCCQMSPAGRGEQNHLCLRTTTLGLLVSVRTFKKKFFWT